MSAFRWSATFLAVLLAACSGLPQRTAEPPAPAAETSVAAARAEPSAVAPETAAGAHGDSRGQVKGGSAAGPSKPRAAARSDEIITDLVGELDADQSDLWARIRKGFGIPDLADDPLVQKWEAWYAEHPEHVARMVDRSRRYLYFIVNEVDKREMPLEIALLPMIESAFNPMAYSRSRAAGIWQFIPSTGEVYGLEQNWWVDSRRDVIKATSGALDYLQNLQDRFGDWQLALAAYNWGEGAVSRAQAANRRTGRPEDYASLDMPHETRNYVPKLQAVKNIIRDPSAHGLVLDHIPDLPYFRVVSVDRRIDVKLAAELSEMTVEDFLSLNPQHNRPVIAGGNEFSILLPYDNADIFVAKLALHQQPLVSWQAYTLKKGESIEKVASRFDLAPQALRAVNGIGVRTRVPPGHTLLVPVQEPSFEAAATLQRAVFRPVPRSPVATHRVRRGDTLWAIARRYDVTVDDLKEWNRLKSSRLSIGQRIHVFGGADSMTDQAGWRGRANASTAPKTAAPSASTRTVEPAKSAGASGNRREGAGKGKS